QEAADSTGRRQTQVGVDVDLAHAVLDGFLDLFHRYTVGLFDVTTELIDDGQPVLRYRGRAMHHQVGVGEVPVDLFDPLNRQDVTRRRTGKLVGTMTGADGNGQRIHLGRLDEMGGLLRVGQHLAVIQDT